MKSKHFDNLDYLDAEFFLPELNVSMNGYLQIRESGNYFVLPENPFGILDYRPISIAYVTTNQTYYTCVESLFHKYDDSRYYYIINELYENVHLEEATIPNCTGITAKIYFLTQWLLPKMLNFEFVEDESFFAKVNINKSRTWVFGIPSEITIQFEAYALVNHRRQHIKITEQSSLKIISDKNLARNEIFACFYSFLIFFTLFLRKSALTTELSFYIEDSEIKLLGLSKEIEEGAFDVLLRLEEIPNFEVLITNYYKKRNDYNGIVKLWESSLKDMRPEIKFLHLTQSLELFHRTFYENDIVSFNQIKNILQASYGRGPTRWTQTMRYLHLLIIPNDLRIDIPFPLTSEIFAARLTKSRNYYTHYGEITGVWNHFELYAVNNTLRIWLRSLVLNQLGLEGNTINKAIKREHNQHMDNDILANKYSIRFGNDFTI